jgi:hypothetical protein
MARQEVGEAERMKIPSGTTNEQIFSGYVEMRAMDSIYLKKNVLTKPK